MKFLGVDGVESCVLGSVYLACNCMAGMRLKLFFATGLLRIVFKKCFVDLIVYWPGIDTKRRCKDL